MRKLMYMVLAGFLGVCPVAQADLGVERTRVVQVGDSPISVRVWNDGARDSLVQVWIDVGDGNARPEQLKVPYAVIAPMFKLAPGRNRDIVIRAISGHALPQDQESAFWLNILDVPSSVRSDAASRIDYAVTWRIKLFHRPVDLKGSTRAAAAALEWSVEGGDGDRRLTARNASAFHVSLADLAVDGRRIDLKPDEALISPFSTWSLDLGSDGNGKQLSFRWVDDNGKTQAGQSQLSSR